MVRAPRMEPSRDESAGAGRLDLDVAADLGDQQADGLQRGVRSRKTHRERPAVVEDRLDDAVRHDPLRPAEQGRAVAFEQPDLPDVGSERVVDGKLAVPHRHDAAW